MVEASLFYSKDPKIWHRSWFENSCQTSSIFEAFLQLISNGLSDPFTTSPKAFSRRRKLPLPKLFLFLLFLTAGGKSQGVDGKSGVFFRHARRSGLWSEAEAVHRSAVTKARPRLSWTTFEQLHHDAVRLAYELWPASEEDTWQGLSVFAIDGSKRSGFGNLDSGLGGFLL